MSDREWIDAVREGKRVSAYSAHYGERQLRPHAEGKAVAYSMGPMVLIETENGEQIWWKSELTFIEEDA